MRLNRFDAQLMAIELYFLAEDARRDIEKIEVTSVNYVIDLWEVQYTITHNNGSTWSWRETIEDEPEVHDFEYLVKVKNIKLVLI